MSLAPLRGRVAYVFDEADFDVDQIVGVENIRLTDPDALAACAMRRFDPGFAEKVVPGDVVVADDTAKFTVSFLNIGLVPDWGLTYTLPRRIGWAAARRLALTRERVDAAEGYRLGIVDILVGERAAMDVALEQARMLGGSALGGYAAIKAMTEDREALRAALRREAETQMERSRTWEHAEGIAAFKEKRRPDYARKR